MNFRAFGLPDLTVTPAGVDGYEVRLTEQDGAYRTTKLETGEAWRLVEFIHDVEAARSAAQKRWDGDDSDSGSRSEAEKFIERALSASAPRQRFYQPARRPGGV
jgi:hypothetical protein